mgnify:CR=1 FL=1
MFIAGTADTSAIWYFVPVLLSIKIALPLMAAVALAFAQSSAPARSFAIATLFLIATMVVFQVQTGIRFLLPLWALAIAWAGSRLAKLAEQARMVSAAMVIVMAIDAAMVWPDALRFVNPFWGGIRDGYRAVSDSNYDWGQGMPELERWREAR